MKIYKETKTQIELKYKDFEDKLKIKIKDISVYDEIQCIKILDKQGRIFVLQCNDVKELFNVDYNIFDEYIVRTKHAIVVLHNERKEIYRGTIKKWLKTSKN